MRETDVLSETAEVTAQPETVETPSAETAPEVAQEQSQQTVGRSIYDTHQPLNRPGTFYSDPQCKNPIPPGGFFHYTYDANGNLVDFEKLARMRETSSETVETAPRAGGSSAEIGETRETVGRYTSDDWSIEAGVCAALGDRAGYERAMENCIKALKQEAGLSDPG